MVKLVEMFSPLAGPKQEQHDVDWIDDLKFFIDHNHDLMVNHMMPAIHKHTEYADHPEVHKVYLKPLMHCIDEYCDTFDIDEKEENFPIHKVEDLARSIAGQQAEFIKQGHYKKNK